MIARHIYSFREQIITIFVGPEMAKNRTEAVKLCFIWEHNHQVSSNFSGGLDRKTNHCQLYYWRHSSNLLGSLSSGGLDRKTFHCKLYY